MLWKDVDADVLEETAKQLLKEINNRINSEVRSTDAFQGLVKSVKNFLSTCPLIMALRHPSMRPRHWTLLQVGTRLFPCMLSWRYKSLFGLGNDGH
jgi:hypothetical protein